MKVFICNTDNDPDLELWRKWEKMNFCHIPDLAVKLGKDRESKSLNLSLTRAINKINSPTYGIHPERN